MEGVIHVELSVAVAPARRAWAQRIATVCRWAMAHGRPVKPDLIALIIAARRDWRVNQPGDTWTRLGVYTCLYADVFNWCSINRVLVPEHVPEALWTYLHYLRAEGLLGPDSDPFRELLRPLRCYGGLGPDGRRQPEGTRRRVRCVCKVPYRRGVPD